MLGALLWAQAVRHNFERSISRGVFCLRSTVPLLRSVQFPNGQSFEQTFVALLQKYGYQGKYKSADWLRKPVFIQSFATTALQKAAQSTDLPLVFLYDSPSVRTQDTNQVSSRAPRPASIPRTATNSEV
jgi:glycerophosphoryl diester phosphodiesterase